MSKQHIWIIEIRYDMATSQALKFFLAFTDSILYDQIFEGTLPLKVESTQIVIDCLVRKQ